MIAKLRHVDYLEHIIEAIGLARSHVEGLTKEEFMADKKTQQAVILNIIVIGEAATKIADESLEFAAKHSGIPWKQMRGMRNRMAHGYFEINLGCRLGYGSAIPAKVRAAIIAH